MAFFDSDIVQEEAKRLFGDYQQLMQLGSDYGKFDREGKKKFIDTMEELMERYRVFMKRFELSEDFQGAWIRTVTGSSNCPESRQLIDRSWRSSTQTSCRRRPSVCSVTTSS